MIAELPSPLQRLSIGYSFRPATERRPARLMSFTDVFERKSDLCCYVELNPDMKVCTPTKLILLAGTLRHIHNDRDSELMTPVRESTTLWFVHNRRPGVATKYNGVFNLIRAFPADVTPLVPSYLKEHIIVVKGFHPEQLNAPFDHNLVKRLGHKAGEFGGSSPRARREK